MRLWIYLAAFLFFFSHSYSHAETSDKVESDSKESPWLLVPTFSSDPKIGTSLGLLAMYLHKFDPESTASMFGAAAVYSSTDSKMGGVFARLFFDRDRKRLNLFAGGGEINNDYSDFLGSGLPLSTTDDLKAFFARYLHEISPGWFLGVQGIYTNYLIVGDNWQTNEILKLLGLTGYDAAGLGLVAQFDDRDNQNSPTKGRSFTAHNFAYREGLGGEDSFDTLNLEYKHFLPHGEDNVLAMRVSGRWTSDAPAGGYSSVSLRGYTRGQYLAPHSTTLEIEDRRHLRGRFGMHLFAGVTCLYGNDRSCDDQDNLYPAIGAGMQYLVKPDERLVVTMDLAKGKADNSGFYLRFGQAF